MTRQGVLWAGGAAFSTALILLTWMAPASRVTRQRAVLESAILPPKAFRDWVYENTKTSATPSNEIPMDRFSGRGLGKSRQTVMPGYEEQDAKELREAYEEKYRSLQPDMEKLDAEIAKEGETPELREQKLKLDEELKDAKDAWMAAQGKVIRLNKELVNGKLYHWNKENGLGGSDNFVPVEEAHAQLIGGGYGKRYSIVDWLAGE
ncbi:hypothetical protein GUITHDRAFT_154349 [Guillardia theta CCMP2712]|uniref:Uncharacterized protein n=1 Tax=Guillardia theta (strain CCMP2712) TaxID=905079 RepID=L1IUB5_GUITC|nr:hypothetical protein GUITHDRAFT_154349 [Guillardia theta CCMP2712]EKX39707.1 hypothetical protein GUITHDRAFT_154349 [Guillardia theta CCMP2712]|eukprot:XP_005826687.1 hypothetical protein GUITHDRAFT_154349 [Guillardia theta CCMP2712]